MIVELVDFPQYGVRKCITVGPLLARMKCVIGIILFENHLNQFSRIAHYCTLLYMLAVIAKTDIHHEVVGLIKMY